MNTFFSSSFPSMRSLLFVFFCFALLSVSYGVYLTEFLYPNFTASNLHYVHYSGGFLFSRNRAFKAAMFNPGDQNSKFYFCVIHVASNAVIWSANRNAPVSNLGEMRLTEKGICVTDQNGYIKWSTPKLRSQVSALMLTEMGNLVLLNRINDSLWESFQNPTDTIVMGQRVRVGTSLVGSLSVSDFSTGDYRFTVGSSDALMQWHGQSYWKLSMDTRAHKNMNYQVEYMKVNKTGLFLLAQNGSEVVIQVALPESGFRIARIASSGAFIISSYDGEDWNQEFVGPGDNCQIPFVCGRIGLCTNDETFANPTCSCPKKFHASPDKSGGCVPSSQSFSLPFSCKVTRNSRGSNPSNVLYLTLGYGIDYFETRFTAPMQYGMNLSACQDFCTRDCFCLGVFHNNSSGACYVLEKVFGSITLDDDPEDRLSGYVKAIFAPQTDRSNTETGEKMELPVAALVLIPFSGFIVMFAFVILIWWRRSVYRRENCDVKPVQQISFSSGDLGAFHIPGLPKRFGYEELAAATDNFMTQIGSGGFGAVYKGVLSDSTVVAVKKITNFGVRGKREFCTEIAVIGNIRHANLVKLRGFCAQGRQLLLVYEYMNRGSLDRSLFGTGPALEWQKRFDIALGTARGLSYLHGGCEQKIIHCDVKPENILLHDCFQAKISDFGLSKLLSPDETSLFTTMRGTRGYLAPEWLTNAAISEKADVYSYGMVLLELVSGRKNCLSRSRSQSHSLDHQANGHDSSLSSHSSSKTLMYFPLHALEMHERGKYLELADPRLEGRVASDDVAKMVRIALCCVHEEPLLRPTMASVVGMLEGTVPVGKPRLESLNFLRFYGLRFAEASTAAGGLDEDTVLCRRTSATGASQRVASYVSSQQVSGPR